MSDKETPIVCPNCGANNFEDVGYTWVGSKGVKFYQQNESVFTNHDNCEDETYWDDYNHLFFECLSCDTAYIFEKENGKQKLVKIDEGDISINKKSIKKSIIKLQETRKKLDQKIRQALKNKEKLEDEAEKLEKFIAISSRPPEKSILKGLRNLKNNG